MQSDLFHCKVILHVPPSVARTGQSPNLATLGGSSCTDIMTRTGGCGYSFYYS